MNPLQYTSDEMVSSTELIRKSKKVFDRLQNNEIEKAIILRDGKPSFMLLDFTQYEEIMSEYVALKNMLKSKDKKKKKEKITQDNKEKMEEEYLEQNLSSEELNDEDLENALAEIDNLDLESLDETAILTEEEKKEQLKEFWE